MPNKLKDWENETKGHHSDDCGGADLRPAPLCPGFQEKGQHRPSQRGDQIVIFNILIPEKLSDEEKALYTKLYELQTGKQPQKSIISKVKGDFK